MCVELSLYIPFCSYDHDLKPMTLLYELGLYILNTYQDTKLTFIRQSFQKSELKQDRHTDRCDQTHYDSHIHR